MIGGRERPVSGPLILIVRRQSIRVEHLVRLADWPVTGKLSLILTRSLTGPLARTLALLPAAPRAAAPELLSPKLSDLLTYLLLEPRI